MLASSRLLGCLVELLVELGLLLRLRVHTRRGVTLRFKRGTCRKRGYCLGAVAEKRVREGRGPGKERGLAKEERGKGGESEQRGSASANARARARGTGGAYHPKADRLLTSAACQCARALSCAFQPRAAHPRLHPRACARVRVYACARVPCACARVRVCACARVRVYACARVPCACARARVRACACAFACAPRVRMCVHRARAHRRIGVAPVAPS
eukprot:1655496-Pleurochrysis_carterae.AAC.1